MTLLDTNILIEIYKDNVDIASNVDNIQEIALTLNRKDFAYIPNLKLYKPK